MRRLQTNFLLRGKNLWLLLMLFVSTAAIGQNSISGNVSDKTGEGVPGASVLVKGTSVGTITDLNGDFTLSTPEGTESVVISFVGYIAQTVSIAGKTNIKVTLEEDVETLSEVVVVGYGTQKRADLTGAIVSADSKMLNERGVTSATQALQGRVAGVNITNTTGQVGEPMSVQIRGNNSLGGGSPLYVVDGVVCSNIDFLNPQDIAKIDILKDASSAAIYGSRGSNGVILISTKNGANVPSGTSISLETYYGVKKTARLPEMMSPEKWKYYHMSAYLPGTKATDAASYEAIVLPAKTNSVLKQRFDDLDGFDWYDAVLQDGMQSNTNLTINHRNGASAYSLGIGFQNETGNIAKEGLDKYTMRLAMDQKISDKVKAGANFSMSLSNIQRGSAVAMQEAIRLNPFLSPWAVDANGKEIVGELFPQPGKLFDANGKAVIDKTSTYNPILEINNSSDETRQFSGVGSTYLQYDPISWVSLKSTLSTGLQTYRRGKFSGAMTNDGIKYKNEDGEPQASSSIDNYENFNYTLDNQANVKKTIGQHAFNLLLVQSTFVSRTEQSNLSSRNQPYETEFYNIGSGLQSTYNVGSNFSKYQMSSFTARLNYGFQDKYLLTLTNRWDGGSVLAEGQKWNSFPSVGIAWKIMNESFMPKTDVISDLKIRGSFGLTGNNRVDPYNSVNTLNATTYYDFNGSAANGAISTNLGNKALTWETTTEKNIGLDYSLFNYRVNGSVDVYNRLSDGVIADQKLGPETGKSITKANSASIRNSGVELMLSTTNIQTKLVKWETSLTFSKNKNSIESLYGQKESDDVGNGWFIGENVQALYNYKYIGVWQAGEDAAAYNQKEGEAKVLDVNNDGKIDPDDDRVIIGSPTPNWVGGLTSNLRVGNFDLNISIYTSQGATVFSNFHANFEDTRDRGRQKLDLPNWYVPANVVGVAPQASNLYPQPRNEGTYWINNQVGYYKDASYVKVQNISLGYTLPSSLLEKIKMDYLRVYVNVLNPFVFTDYTGWDPEWANAPYAVARVANTTTQVGLSLKF
jgi:TonB-dependent starch-binding outer membrane protein SusC